jgi:hypothetical protein
VEGSVSLRQVGIKPAVLLKFEHWSKEIASLLDAPQCTDGIEV